MSLTGSMKSPGDLEEAVTWLAYSSFAINPFFYGLLNRQIREELVKFRRCCLTQPADFGTSSHEGSLQENFLQFIQRTSSSKAETPSSCANSNPRKTTDQGVKIPGQIPEEQA
ncbi:putative G-protein coupled receptor [Dissostichus eleginoides]|uniref:G-protein coupled receptor n=1 Tax=Dissostichus eleginoides TaxID=100907 RepID=A0AAD9CKR3_DISEL|nr:putative G-protein coupled receptor [Dissostichus eleginoides]